MFEGVEVMGAAELRSGLDALGRPVSARDDAERIDRIDLLERLKAVAAAAQVRLTADLVESQARVAEQAEDRGLRRSAGRGLRAVAGETRRGAGGLAA